MVNVFDAAGKDAVLIETVGVGQDEVEIVNSAHTTILVTIPGMGDDVQAIKAGIMEIGDIFVVNKADREGSRKTVRELMNLIGIGLRRRNGEEEWEPRIVETEAIKGRGIDKLYETIETHRAYLRRYRYAEVARASGKAHQDTAPGRSQGRSVQGGPGKNRGAGRFDR